MTLKKPFPPPPGRPAQGKPEFVLDSSETFLFDIVAQEVNEIAGTAIEYYSLDRVGSVKDPLYDEAEERAFRGPYKVKAHVTYPEQGNLAQADGLIARWDSVAWLARKTLEDAKCPAPQPGDVIRIWNTPFFNSEAVLEQDIPDSGFFFNVLNVNQDGHVFDTASFVGFKLTLRRRSDFTPERRITNT